MIINDEIRIEGLLNSLKRKDFAFSEFVKGVTVVILAFTFVSCF